MNNSVSMDFIGEPLHPFARVLFTFICVLVLFCGVCGNGFLLLVLATQKTLWRVHNIFIANLALADLLVICSTLPFLLADLVLGYYPVTGKTHCQVNGLMLCVCYSASSLSLICISFNRYMKVCHAQMFITFFSCKKNALLCGGMWLVAFILNAPLLIGNPPYGPYGYDKGSHICNARPNPGILDYGTMGMATHLVFPFIAIFYFNYAIFRYWKQSQIKFQGESQGISRSIFTNASYDNATIPHNQTNLQSNAVTASDQEAGDFITRNSLHASTNSLSQKKDAKAKSRMTASEMALIRSLLVISICLFVLYTPFAICIVINLFAHVPAELIVLDTLFLFINCAINWVIYGVMNTSFSKAYMNTLHCIMHLGQVGDKKQNSNITESIDFNLSTETD